MKLFKHEIHFSFRSRVPPEEMVCFGCGRHDDNVQKLIAGPPGVFICDECVAQADLALATYDSDPSSGLLQERTEGGCCSFCSKSVAVATAGAEIGICQACIDICQNIISEDSLLKDQLPEV